MVTVDQAQLWRETKWGKFSASEEWKLTFSGKYDKTLGITPMLGEGAVSYVKKIARQAVTLYNDEDQPMTYSMKMGIAKEPFSFAELEKQLGRRDLLTYYGGNNPRFDLYTPDSGTSPDSVSWKDETKLEAHFGGELKNPSGDVHLEYLLNIKNDKDLQKVSIEYYTQCQKALMTYKCPMWLWCTHNEFFRGRDRMLIIEVHENKNFQNDLEARIHSATKMKYEIIEQLKNR